MVVNPKAKNDASDGSADARRMWRATKRRVLWWSVMASAVLWTLVYQAAKKDSALPEFVYVNF